MINQFPVNYPEMVVEKSHGVTQSEKRLVDLGYNTFLSLWSYPNPYKQQAYGKELCDLLVVFDNNIIIFSDKDCVYGASGDSQVDWRRWYKKAILKSAEQLLGAKAWLEKFPDRITLDAKGEKPFPLKITITPETKFYLIAVAHGASEPCKMYFSGGDGGLLIDSNIKGKMHIGEDCEPFTIGLVEDNPESFIHVFDDASYATVLHELDTIEDFLGYLDGRQEILLKKSTIAVGENELLAQHISGLIDGNATCLQRLCKEDCTDIVFQEGQWDELIHSEKYRQWRKKLEISYFWDGLLQRTFYFIENGLSAGTTSPTLQDQNQLFRRLAKEDRIHRYCLSDAFLSFFFQMPPDFRGTRVIYSESEPDICFLLFLLPRNSYMSDEEYRRVRRKMLSDYCLITKTDFPDVSQVIGVAHESSDIENSSEDFVCLDASSWTDADQENALRLRMEYQSIGALGERRRIQKTYFQKDVKMKGRDRNKLCPCGSGKKYKKCCGMYKN